MNAALGLPADAPAGFHHATTDPNTIRTMWAGDRAGSWIGLRMGSGRMAIDLDEKNGKSGTATMQANGWTLPQTATQRTPSNGWHCIVDMVPGAAAPTDANKIGAGVDRRGDGGYINLYDAAVLTAQRAPAPEWSLAAGQSNGSARIPSADRQRAPSYALALEALNARDPSDFDRAEWLLFSGAFYTATEGLAPDAQRLADWQTWNVRHGDGNDPAGNTRTWAGFARSGTGGDWHTLVNLSGCPNAIGWRWFKGEVVAAPSQAGKPNATSLFVHVRDMRSGPPMFIIDRLLEEDAFAVLFGDPAAGKSLVALDMAACVATGCAFHGESVKTGGVFYIAGEGHNGLRRRLAAWEELRGERLDAAAFHVSRKAVQFLDVGSAALVTDAIEALAAEHGAPRLIVVDTLARNFGPGDENSQKDMTAFVASLDGLRARFPGSSVLLVHHSGHGEKDRARGSSVLRAAADAEFKVDKKDTAITLSNYKMKDAAPPSPMRFELVEAAQSVALEFAGEGGPTGALPKQSRIALDALAEDRLSHEDWRVRFYAKREGNPDAKRKAFAGAVERLIAANYVVLDRDTYHRVAMPGMPEPR